MGRVKIGKAKYGNTQKKFWKLKDGESVYRILPPLGDLAQDGRWSVYYKIHYGYKNIAGKARPFESCLVVNRKSKIVEIPDAATERLDKLTAQLKIAKENKDEKAKEALFKLVGGQKSVYNCDNNHYMNAMDTQGNIGVLKLRHKAKLALDLVIKALRDKGTDPLSVDNGRFFVFTRNGSGMETTFNVSVYKEKLTVESVGEVERDVAHKLSDDILDRLGDEAAELQKLFKKPSSEEVAAIVKASELVTGITPGIDDILGIKTKGDGGGTSSEGEDEAYEDEAGDEETTELKAAPAQAAAAQTVVETPKAAVTQTPPVVETAKEAAAAPKAAAKAAPAAATQTTSEKLAGMSDADFLKSLGIS